MSPRRPAGPWSPDRRVLSGGLWLVGGALLPLGAGLAVGLAVGLLVLGIWCMATSMLIWRQR